MKKFSLVGVVLLMSFLPFQLRKTKVYLVGDSTCAKKEIKAYPETGWGMPFTYFFDSTIEVDNRALNGRSTRTFIEEKRWQPILDDLHEGDYVFVQFGHNDEVPTKKSATTPDEFKNNLVRYVTETRSKKAFPVLITPVARRKFDENGKLVPTHEQYSAIVRTVAAEQNVPLIDLDKSSQQLLQQVGAENSKFFYNHLKPGEHPNYPEGKEDDTHFSELGARKMAELVLADLRKLQLPLAKHIYSPATAKK